MGKINSTLKLGPGIAKNLALGNATVRAIYERRRIQQGFSPDKDQAEYPLTVFHTHAAALAPLRPAGLIDTDFLEIGPGGNVGVGLLMLLAGAKSVTCLDVVPWMQGTGPDALYAALVETAAKFPETYFVAPTLLERAKADPAGLAHELLGRIKYLYPVDIASTTLPDASLDVIISHACFEHFPDPAGSIAQIARLLRPGGVTSHQVDLRDHRDFDHPLEFLYHSDAVWHLATHNSPNQVRNRWRASEYRAAFEQQGVEVISVQSTLDVTVTEEMRRQFFRHFQTMDLKDLGMVVILLVGRKKEAGG